MKLMVAFIVAILAIKNNGDTEQNVLVYGDFNKKRID